MTPEVIQDMMHVKIGIALQAQLGQTTHLVIVKKKNPDQIDHVEMNQALDIGMKTLTLEGGIVMQTLKSTNAGFAR